MVCVDLGELTGGGTSAGETTGKDTGEATTEGTPPPSGSCSNSAECADNEVCVDGVCGDTDLYYFDVRVTSFAPDSCADGWGNAEVYFALYNDPGVLLGVSTAYGCPAAWPDLELPRIDSVLPFELDFWEDDEFDDDYLATLCWDASGNATADFEACSVVPKYWLHQGSVQGYIGANNQYGVAVTFTPYATMY